MFKVFLAVFHALLSHLLDIKWHLQYRGESSHTLIKSNVVKTEILELPRENGTAFKAD